MTASFVSVQATTGTSNGKTATPTLGTVTDGHLLLWFGCNNKGSAESYSTVPAGWTNELAPQADGTTSGSVQGRVDYRIASADTGNSYQWVLSGFCEFTSALLEYAGIDNTTPFDVTPVYSNADSTSLAGITTVSDGCMLVYVAMFADSSATITATDQAGWTGRVARDAGGTVAALYIADKLQSTHGATGTVGPTWSSPPSKIVSALFALRPSGGATTNPSSTDSATLTASSSLSGNGITITGTDSATLDDSATQIDISDGQPDATLTDTASVRFAAAVTDSATLTDTSAVTTGPSTADTFTFSDVSSIAITGTNPSSGDLFTLTDSGSLNSSNTPSSADTFTLDDVALIVEAAFPKIGATTVTIVGPQGVVTISEGM